MLQKIHERVQGVIAWVLIILIAVTFTLWGINYYFESRSTSDTQAEVNGEKISKADFSNTYQRLKRQAEQKMGELSPAQEEALKKRALKQLIFTRVVLQGAQSSGYLVTQEQAEQALMQIPQFQEDGQFSAEKFQQALSSALYTPAVFLTKIQEGLVINQQRFAFAGTTFVLPQEITQLVKLAKQSRDLSYTIIPWQKFSSPTENISVSSDELHLYYEKNKEQFKVPEKVSISYIVISMKKILSHTHVSEKALKNYYNDNIDAYTHPAQWRWAHILIRVSSENKKADQAAYHKALNVEKALHQGMKFSVAVKKYSDDVLSVSQSGVMPWVPQLAVDDKILPVLEQLKPGDSSDPIKTQYGYEIIQRVGYQAPKKIPFNEVKKQIKEIIKTDKAQQVFAQMGDDLTNLSYQNPSSLNDAAKELELPIKTTPFFTHQGLPKGITSYKPIAQAAFSDEVLQDGNNSQVIAIDDSLMVVLRVKKHLAPSVKPLSAVQEILQKQIIQEKAAKKAQAYGEEWITLLKKQTPQKVSPFTWTTQKGVSRDNSTLNATILSTLFKMPLVVNDTPVFQGVTLDNGDYAVLKLTRVQPGSIDSLDREEEKMFEDEMEAAEGIVDYNLYVEGLMHQAKIIEEKK
jgi:peptidyl-prolyl cis-trans isomerase D